MGQDLCLPPPAFARSLHVARRLGLVYVNNPKVACSSIKLTLQRAELDDPDYEPATSVHDHAASPLLTVPELDPVSAPQALQDRFVFSFVRHPLDRLRSAYLNKIVTGQKGGRPREMAGFARDVCPSFDAFVQAICAQDPTTQNPHWRPQALNLSVSSVRYDLIGRLEDFARDWATLAAQTGLPDTPSFAGRRTAHAQKAALDLSAGSHQAIRRAYAMDFDAFGYDPA